MTDENKIAQLNGISYVLCDIGSLRLAVPFDGAVENPQKIILELKKHFKKQGDCSFVAVYQECADRLNQQIFQKMPTIKPIQHFVFFVTSDPNVRGIMGAPGQQTLGGDYPKALQVSTDIIENGYSTKTAKSSRSQICGIHELAHVLHGGYFDFNEFGQICEGFAELVPFYLMDMEQQDEKHHNDILNLQEKDILTLDFLNHAGYFGLGKPKKANTVQDLRTYQSAYLWMLGYIKRVEEQHGCDKFKAAEMVLNKFAAIAPENWSVRSKQIAAFVDMPLREVFSGKTLQLAGQKHIADIIQNHYKQNKRALKPHIAQLAEKEPLTMIADKKESLAKLGHIGLLFQNIASQYLKGENERSSLLADAQKLTTCIEHFRATYGLTKKDALRAVCYKFDQYSDWPVTPREKQKAIAWLLCVDKEKIAEIWEKPVLFRGCRRNCR